MRWKKPMSREPETLWDEQQLALIGSLHFYFFFELAPAFGVTWRDKIRIRLTCNKIKYVSDKSDEEVYGQTNAGRIDERRLYVSVWRRKGKNYWWSRWKIGFFQIQIENLKWWQDLNRKEKTNANTSKTLRYIAKKGNQHT